MIPPSEYNTPGVGDVDIDGCDHDHLVNVGSAGFLPWWLLFFVINQ